MSITGIPAGVSQAFEAFSREAPDQAKAWMQVTQALAAASALDRKTQELTYLAVLAALRLTGGIPFHVRMARAAGASRAEVISAILIGLQPAGHGVTASLPIAIDAYDTETSPGG